jgi:hypothetical protein
LVQTYQNGKKYIEWPQIMPNGHKWYQMAIKYSKLSLKIPTFTIQRPSKIDPKLGFWVWKQTIWQPWFRNKRWPLLCDFQKKICRGPLPTLLKINQKNVEMVRAWAQARIFHLFSKAQAWARLKRDLFCEIFKP